jgi:diguanylate cyclase (GGDEF)-like protein/PAS domain S-box-containing protein
MRWSSTVTTGRRQAGRRGGNIAHSPGGCPTWPELQEGRPGNGPDLGGNGLSLGALRSFSRVAAVLVILTGLLVLLGWTFEIEGLKSLLCGRAAMNRVTASAMILSGALLLLNGKEQGGPWTHGLTRAAGFAIAVVGLIRLTAYLSGWEIGIDGWLVAAELSASASLGPDRMGPNTALTFVLIGLGLMFLDRESSHGHRLAQFFPITAAVIALFAIIGYTYGVDHFYNFPSFVPMALPTAVSFALLSLGLLCVRPNRGIMAAVTSEGSGSTLARRLLPAAVLVPALIGGLSLAGERAGYYGTGFGVFLLVASQIVVITALIGWNARSLYRTEAERQQAEEALRRAHDELEVRVYERTAELIAAHQVLQEEIEERKRVDAGLRRSEAELRTIFDITAVGMAQTDPSGRYLRVNRKFCEITGYTAEELLGKVFSEITHPEDRERDSTAFRRLMEGDVLEYLSEKRYVRKDGSAIWVNVSAALLRDEAGGPLRLVAVIEDITARRRSEQAIRNLNAQLERRLERIGGLRQIDLAIIAGQDLHTTLDTVLEQVRDRLGADAADVLLLDPHSNALTYAAGRGFRGTGITRTRLPLGQGYAGRAGLQRRLAHIADLPADRENFVRAPLLEEEGFIAYFGVPFVAKGHLHGVLEVFHRAPLDPDPEWLGFLEALADQAAIAAENDRLFAALERSNSELASSYDATIEGWAHALDLRDKETEGHSRRVTSMAVHLARVMGFDSSELVHVRRGALLHDIGKMGVSDAILLKPGPLTDEERAVMQRHPEYAYEWLSQIAFLRPALEIPYCHHEKWDGTGYPRGLMGEQIPLAARIFAAVDIWDALNNDRPYRKAWPEAKVREHLRSLSGTHLDPQVVDVFLRTLAAQWPGAPVSEGHSDAANPGQERGLPRPGGLAQFGDRPEPPSVHHRGMRTLVADDDVSSSLALKRILESLGHEVLLAGDGDEAWSLVQEFPIELVITDWVMPRLDGPEFCRRIRRRSGRPYTYVVLITGKGGDEDRLEALDAGADDFLTKPVDARELAARLKIAGRMLTIQDELLNRSLQVERMYAELRCHNERLTELATTDELTGVQNRRKFHEALEKHLGLAARQDLPLSVLLLDLDEFKPYNDRHGHLAGDDALRTVARILRANVRGHDVVARYGGEEFAVLLPATDACTSRILSERLRQAIEDHGWPLRRVTASLGIATTSPGPAQPEALLGAADMALYHSKGKGRNCVTHHDDLRPELALTLCLFATSALDSSA